jgi:hypothetical protein
MNHYQKLATLLVRCAGMMALGLGLTGFVYGSVLLTRGRQFTPDQAERFTISFWYVLVGLVIFVAGRPLGRLLGRKLD